MYYLHEPCNIIITGYDCHLLSHHHQNNVVCAHASAHAEWYVGLGYLL